MFETQLERLQDGDRFYYLERNAGLNFVTELENNSFAKMVMANTSATHLPALIFQTNLILEVDQAHQFNAGLGNADPVGDSPLTPLVIRDDPAAPGPDTNYLQYTGPDHVVLGGTAGNDIMISSEGDDSLWGDAGNDRLEGGFGNDSIRGGPGDDIITDIGGDDNIQGDDGNDVIHGGPGINLILGGFGSDFIITGEDASEAFGGSGNDFILGSDANEQDMGNEGDDWLEFGNLDGNPGDNFDPFGRDLIAGNDVYIGSGGPDIMNGEGGDDIMVGSSGPGDKYLGASGFDWATFKDDPTGVEVDLNIRALNAAPVPAAAGILARFSDVEGLSGSKFSDMLTGDNADALTIPNAGLQGSVLTNIGLINGLQGFLGAGVTSFSAGNIILGGDGSDLIEGRGGDDLSDQWLNVRISVRANADGTGAEIATFDHMTDLVPHMLAGTYNPGQLQIVREILPGNGEFNFDTAVFTDLAANYSVVTDANGVTTVTHLVQSDGVAILDGIDRLTNIERLQFNDSKVILAPGLNAEPVGAVSVSDLTPGVGQVLTASAAGVTDGDNAGEFINGPVSFVWQVETAAGSGVFQDIQQLVGVGVQRALGPTFEVTPDLNGLVLRVKGIYQDDNGVLETVFSAPIGPVVPVVGGNTLPAGTLSISDTTPTEGQTLTALNTITDADGLTGAVFNHQWQASADGVTWTPIAGAAADSFTPTQAEVGRLLRVVVTFNDDGGTLEQVFSAPTSVVGDVIIGTDANETLTGTEGQDEIQALAGHDILIGLGGNDTLTGGTGNDLLDGGTGADTMSGGVGNDVYLVDDTLDAVSEVGGGIDEVRTTLASYALGPNNVENLTFIGVGNFTGTGNAVANVIVGGAGDDQLSGGQGHDTLTGGAGNDTLIGGTGNDTFVFGPGFGSDRVLDFDADRTGGQDVLDISALGISSVNFAASVIIADSGTDTLLTIGSDSIVLVGIGDPTTITSNDFVLAA